ncbi:Uncharacterised protein [uncultured archaeon]|nr:Uncharacterised protein [uncultured archaeon]
MSARAGYNLLINEKAFQLFYDFPLELGASLNASAEDVKIKPYLVSQFKIYPENMNINTYSLQFNELEAGIKADFPVSNIVLSVNPYYSHKLWEDTAGLNAGIKNKNLELNLGGYFSKSSYEFAPDKAGINAGFSLGADTAKIDLGYKVDWKNYDGEISDKSSFTINGNVKF